MVALTKSPAFLQDRNSVPIPVLQPETPDVLNILAAADTNALPAHHGIVQVANSAGMYWKFATGAGDNADSADSYMPAGQVREYVVPTAATHFSVIHGPEATDGVCSVTPLV
jgi:hypothetical protein